MINIEWRDPLEVGNCLSHIGNENSGRYPRGSGDRPNQHVSSARGTVKKKKKSKKEDRISKLNKSAKSFSDVESKAQNVSSDISKAYNLLYNSKYKNENRAKYLSDDELKNAINRIQLEQRYNELTMPPKSKGYDRAMAAIAVLGSIAGVAATGITIVSGVKSLKKDK